MNRNPMLLATMFSLINSCSQAEDTSGVNEIVSLSDGKGFGFVYDQHHLLLGPLPPAKEIKDSLGRRGNLIHKFGPDCYAASGLVWIIPNRSNFISQCNGINFEVKKYKDGQYSFQKICNADVNCRISYRYFVKRGKITSIDFKFPDGGTNKFK